MARCGCTSASGSVGVADTPTIDMTLRAGIINGAVKLDPAAGNLLSATANGLRIDCAAVAACVGGAAQVTVADSTDIDFSVSGAGTVGDPRVITGGLKSIFYQTSAATWSHTLAGANDVLEAVTELPALTLATPGLYIVNMEVQGTITNASAAAGTGVSSSMSAYMMRAGVLVPNTETRLANVIQGNATTTEPALGVAVTGSATRAVFSDGTTQVTLSASRNLAAGSTAVVNSNSTGRTRITAWRIGA